MIIFKGAKYYTKANIMNVISSLIAFFTQDMQWWSHLLAASDTLTILFIPCGVHAAEINDINPILIK